MPLTVTDFIQLMESEAFPVTVMDGVLRRALSSGEVMVISGGISSVPSNTTVNGICQWKLDTLLNNLDSKCRVDICFG